MKVCQIINNCRFTIPDRRYAIFLGVFIFFGGADFTAAVLGADALFADVFFSVTASPFSSLLFSDNFISILFRVNTSNHFTIFFISLPYTLSKSISGYTFSKYDLMAFASALASGSFSLLFCIAVN